MNGELLWELLENAAVLTTLLVLVHFATAGREDGSLARQVGLGVILGAIAIIVMLTGYRDPDGMYYDVCTVLLSLAGLLFTPVTTLVTVVVAIVHRIQLGGPVVLPGVVAMLIAAGLGTLWRVLRSRKLVDLTWYQLYAFGMLVHVVILPLALSLETGFGVPLNTLPVLLFYPPLVASLGAMLLWWRRQRDVERRNRDQAMWLDLAADLGQLGRGEINLRNERVTLSPEMERQLGFRGRQRVSTVNALMRRAHPEDRKRIEQEFQLFIERATPAQPAEMWLDYRLSRSDGNWLWVRCLVRACDWDEQGRPTRVLLAQANIDQWRRLRESAQRLQREADEVITEASDSRLALLSVLEDHQQAEAALRDSQHLLGEMSHLARITGWEIDLTSGEKRLTSGIYKVYTEPGSDRRTLIQGEAVLDPEDRERVARLVEQCLADETGTIDTEVRFVEPDGTLHWARSVGAVVWEEKKPVKLRGFLQDITPLKKAEAEREKSYDMLVKLAARVPGVIFQFHQRPGGADHFPWISASIRESLELEPEDVRDNGLLLLDRLHREDRARFHRAARQSMALLTPFVEEFRVVLPEQGVQWRRCESVPERLEDGSALWHGIFTDISERKEVEERLQLSSLAYEHSSEAMMIMDAEGRIMDVNAAFTRITGFSREEVLGRPAREMYDGLEFGRESSNFYRARRKALAESGHWYGELRSLRKDGALFDQRLTINAAYDSKGRLHHWVGQFSDITEQKKAERLIWEQAHFDPLTRLPNRRMFHDRLSQEIKHARRTGLPLALLFMDLDHFKEINDTQGHETGDRLLREASERIQACVRETDTVARLGGDEFIIIVTEVDGNIGIEQVCRRLLDTLSNPFKLGSESVYIGASIGVTLYPADADNIDDLLKNADQAMYAAKREGRNRFRYFTPDMQRLAQDRMATIRELRTAQEEGQFSIAYQPIIHLASGRIRSLEALLRWQHPRRGIVYPGEFIDIAEETGMIVDIGDTVFRQVTTQMQAWRQRGLLDLKVCINLSPVQLNAREELVRRHWAPQLAALDLPGESIALEITEGMLLDPRPRIRQELLACREAGILVALDDFGTGYSSLAYLKQFDIDYLKIDPSFVGQLARDSDDLALCEAIIVMAHKLGIEVVAEGVESREQLTLLQEAGCDYAQGFFMARPLEAAAAEASIGEFRL